MTVIPEKDALHVARILTMTTESTTDGECLNAARAASRYLKARNYTWEQALLPTSSPEADQIHDTDDVSRWHEPETEDDIAYELLRWPEVFTEWEIDFLRGIAGLDRLSPKQGRWLHKLLIKGRNFAQREGGADHE